MTVTGVAAGQTDGSIVVFNLDSIPPTVGTGESCECHFRSVAVEPYAFAAWMLPRLLRSTRAEAAGIATPSTSALSVDSIDSLAVHIFSGVIKAALAAGVTSGVQMMSELPAIARVSVCFSSNLFGTAITSGVACSCESFAFVVVGAIIHIGRLSLEEHVDGREKHGSSFVMRRLRCNCGARSSRINEDLAFH